MAGDETARRPQVAPHQATRSRRDRARDRPAPKISSYRESETRERVPILTPYSEIREREMRFLWEPYIPEGKLCFLDGNRDGGKTWIALAIASAISKGEPLPGAQTNRKPRKVIYMNLENNPEESVKKRLRWLQADPANVIALDGFREGSESKMLTLGHIDVLDDAIARTRAVLLILDPFLAYLPKGHHHAEGARRVMTQLISLGRRYRCSILGIRHPTKDGKIRGSSEIDNAARSMMLVGFDGQGRKVLSHYKHNDTPAGVSLVFDVGEGKFDWLGESTLTAEDLLAKKKPSPKQQAAGEYLMARLRQGPVPETQLVSEACALGISRATLRRAKEALGILSRRVGGRDGYWAWELPRDVEASEPRPAPDREDEADAEPASMKRVWPARATSTETKG